MLLLLNQYQFFIQSDAHNFPASGPHRLPGDWVCVVCPSATMRGAVKNGSKTKLVGIFAQIFKKGRTIGLVLAANKWIHLI